jgi:hypothetical protein
VSGLSKREEIVARVIGTVIAEFNRDGEIQHTALHHMKLGKDVYRAWAATAVEIANAIICETGGQEDPRGSHDISRLRRFGNRYVPALRELGINTVSELAAKLPSEIVVHKKIGRGSSTWIIAEAQSYLEDEQ